MQEILDRKEVILSEYGVKYGDDDLVFEFMNMSERAFKRREDRRKAASEGKTYIG